MLPVAALKKRAKEHSLHKLIAVMHGLEMKDGEEDPKHELGEDPAMEAKEPMDPEQDPMDGGLPPHHAQDEMAMTADDPDKEFRDEQRSFMKRGLHSPIKGKTRLMIADARAPKKSSFPPKGKRY